MNYRKIFSVINEQTVSTVSARYALMLAVSCKAELVLYAAHAKGSTESVIHHTERHLEHLYDIALELGIQVTQITEIGNIGRLLPKRVVMENADLVFYPLRSDERYGARLRQQTVDQLLKSNGSDLAVMRVVTMAKPHPGRILVPLGTIANDRERRLVFIAELAKSFHAQVTLLHLSAEYKAKGLSSHVALFRQQLQQQQITVLERSGRSDSGRAIIVEAITRRNDLLVLGASEHGILRRFVSGDPVGDVMRQPPCNVILFRAGKTP